MFMYAAGAPPQPQACPQLFIHTAMFKKLFINEWCWRAALRVFKGPDDACTYLVLMGGFLASQQVVLCSLIVTLEAEQALPVYPL